MILLCLIDVYSNVATNGQFRLGTDATDSLMILVLLAVQPVEQRRPSQSHAAPRISYIVNIINYLLCTDSQGSKTL